MTRKGFVAAVALLALVRVTPAAAQGAADGGPDPAKVRVRIGPLYMNPTISLTNLGIDTNVFNDTNEAAPKQDFTATITPATDLWLHLGRSWLTANISENLVYYQKYANQRSASPTYKLAVTIPLNRLKFTGTGGYANLHDRPGFEIDVRVQHINKGLGGTAEIRALSKTYFGVSIGRQMTTWAEDAVFLNSNLRTELTEASTTATMSVRHQLTPLTSLTLDVSRAQDRFEFSSLRDSNSTAITAGVTFDPFALIKGGASFGYRHFQPLSPGLPGYRGGTAAVSLSYVAFGTTKFGLQATRNVQYSYDVNQPYYVLTGANGSLSQQIFGPLDVVGRVGAQRLDYRDRSGVHVAASGRTDYVHTYGAGFGYHTGRNIRIGFNIDHNHRTSALDFRQYNGMTFGMSVTYGP